MTIFTRVDPERFIDPARQLPPNGRGAWVKQGIDFNYRYCLAPDGAARIGTVAERSLAHWSVAAGCYAIQQRLVSLGLMEPVGSTEAGVFGPRTDEAVRKFQSGATDPESGNALAVDGIVGTSDARALFTPVIDAAEAAYAIPGHLLRGECNHESRLDPGGCGYYIYYSSGTAYRGVDRGPLQINALANPQVSWAQAYDFSFAADWSAKRMRGYYDQFKARYPGQGDDLYWRAAVLAHNNPSAAGTYARTGVITSASAAAYVEGVYNAIY